MIRVVRGMALVAVAAALVIGCGGDDDASSGSTVDLADSLASAAVCNGTPSDTNPPSTDPISGYVYLNGGDGWTSGWFDTFGDQHAIVGDDATAILCVTVTDSSVAQRCEFEDDGESFAVLVMDATYSFSLRNADTANEIGRGVATATGGECPLTTSWTPGEGERKSWPAPTAGDLDSLIDVFFG